MVKQSEKTTACFTRRQLLQRTALAGVMLSAPKITWAAERQPLRIPPLLEVGRGRPVRLDLRPAQTQFNAGKLADVWGVNGQYLAPTVRVKSGNFVKLTYVNNLPQAVSMNIQGLLAPTEMIGSNHRKLEPSQSWSPILTVNQPACTGWYHADTMFNSAFQVYRGLAGLWIIEDGQSKTSKLPNKYGVNDIPLVLQDQQINHNGVQVLNVNQPQFFGNRLFVNGQENGYLDVPRGWVRLRIVNASLSRPYDLQLDNGEPLHLIATGVGMLAEPLARPAIRLAPSERVEVLVEVKDQPIQLTSGAKRNLFDQAKQLFANDNELADNVILELRPMGLAAVFTEKPALPTFDLAAFHLTIAQERKFDIRPLDRLINQQRFDPKRIDFSVAKGTVERWYLTSTESVGFNIQGAKFVLESRGGKPLATKNLAWRDTVWLEKGQTTTILVKFEHSATAQLPFTFGVSDLMLRDRGAMGQFEVLEK